MELVLQKDLKHQEDGVQAVSKVFANVYIEKPNIFYSNPIVNLEDKKIEDNIIQIKNDNSIEDKSTHPTTEGYLSLDVKMETGTGKTYVYTKTIFELNKKYGFNKFIIAVPSLAIKSGTAHFISDGYVKRHFKDVCEYNKEISLGILSSQRSKKKKKYFPSVVDDFVKGSIQNSNKIYVLLINMQLISERKDNLLNIDNYDYSVAGFYRPYDALAATKPILIIDEPHRFATDKTTYTTITKNIKPQCIIRFGATFPNIEEKSKNKSPKKITKKDYRNLLYDLNASASFSQGLIKGVAKESVSSPTNNDEKVKITSINSKTSVKFHYSTKDGISKDYTLYKGESLSKINENFGNICISGLKEKSVIFTNGIEKQSGEVMHADIYMSSYQESMIKVALQRHFEIERKNFCSRNNRIKTLALFFIDDISSYRATEGKNPYLKEAFESLLKEKIIKVLNDLPTSEKEYREYLEASLKDISKCHAGYFSQDNNENNEEITKEVDEILNGKKQLLSFKNADGSYNCRRFLFSKWTLKEGWDNPNVFIIAKLRSSGSDISKLQEVGRGLRLPVDERGNRVSNEDFELNYIVDFTEEDFATKLVAEINEGLPNVFKLSKEKIEEVAKKMNISSKELGKQLITKDYIDFEYNVNLENREAFLEEYPEFKTVADQKIRDVKPNKPNRNNVKINKKAFKDLEELWKILNQKYLIVYEPKLEEMLEKDILSIFENNVFSDIQINTDRKVLAIDNENNNFTVEESTGITYSFTDGNNLPYNEFLKTISKATSIPIKQLHKALCKYAKEHGNDFSQKLNRVSISNFIEKYSEWKANNIKGLFKYRKCDTKISATALTERNGAVKEFITQGLIGEKIDKGTPTEKYLYEKFAYDSELEHKNIITGIDSVVVYGKIPRKSIKIPTFVGNNETYSPDFMYVVKRNNNKKDLNLIVETKDVKSENDLRGNEKQKIKCAEVFFENLSKDGYNVTFKRQINNKDMGEIIKELIEK